MFSKWGVIGWTQSQVSDETNDSLDKGPSRWRMKQFNDDRKSVVNTNVILRHFRLWVAVR
jgi:hypothetical protein